LLASLSAHVDLAEVDAAGVVGQPVDDAVRGDPVGQGLGPVVGAGLSRLPSSTSHRALPIRGGLGN